MSEFVEFHQTTLTLFNHPASQPDNVQRHMSLLEYYTYVRDGTWAEHVAKVREIVDKRERKSFQRLQSPGVAVLGKYSSARIEGFLEPSGLIPFDIDSIDNAAELRDRMKGDPHIVLAYLSASGKGLHGMLRVAPLIADASIAKERYWDKAIPYVQNTYSVTVDGSAGSGKQFFYVSHDSDALWQPGATPHVVRGCGMEAWLATIGDHPPGHGFNDAVTRAAAAGVAGGLDDEGIQSAISECVEKAWWANTKRRDEVLMRAKGGHIRDAVKSARKKFSPTAPIGVSAAAQPAIEASQWIAMEEAIPDKVKLLLLNKQWPLGIGSDDRIELLKQAWPSKPLQLIIRHSLGEVYKYDRSSRELVIRMIEDGIDAPIEVKKPIVKSEPDEALGGKELQVDGRGNPKENFFNYSQILRYHNEWRGRIRFDDFIGSPTLTSSEPRPFTDVAESEIAVWCGENYNLPGDKYRSLSRAVHLTAYEDRYDSLSDFFRKLEPWDGLERLDRWMTEYCGAEDSMYSSHVGRVLIFQMIKRALDPGCIARIVVVLEGEENTGKSQAVGILGYPWVTTFKVSMDSKEAHIQIRGKWVAELVELDTLHRTTEARLKGFITELADEYVPKYANHAVSHKRRTVFIGTTNENRYLVGNTGNTRFLPVRTTGFNLAGLRENRDQLLAEGLVRLNGHSEDRWWDEPEELRETVVSERKARQTGNEYDELVRAFLDEDSQLGGDIHNPPAKPKCWNSTTFQEVAEKALGMEPKNWSNKSLQIEIGKSIKAAGFKRGSFARVRRGWRRIEKKTCFPSCQIC